MRVRDEIEAELAQKREMVGKSDELDSRVRPYINALEWVLDGEAEQVGAVRVGKWNDFDGGILGARTSDGKLFLNEEDSRLGVYSLLFYPIDS